MRLSKSPSTEQSSQLQINDRILIEWFQKNHKQIPFAQMRKFDSYGRTEKLSEAIRNLDPGTDLYLQGDEVAEIWRNLVGKAIVYLKSKDGREKYHDGEDYGVERLHEFFKTFREFETLLYGAEEERYRDHMAHMLSVFLLGEYLIRNRIGFENINVNDEEFPQKGQVSAGEKEAMWCIMSLTHDLGIALEKIPAITPKAKDMLEQFGIIDVQALSYPFPRQLLHDFMIKFISSDLQPIASGARKGFITHIQPKYLLKFSEALERRDHGIVSCLVLMKNLVYFLETDFLLDTHKPFDLEDAKQFLIRRNILRSIAAHSCRNIYHLTVPQFPFLLTIFDEMHEWGRPRFVEMFEKIRPDTVVTVEDLSTTAVHYKVTLSCEGTLTVEEREQLAKQTVKYFLSKCEKIRMILRSAVGGKDRNLELTFEVVDKVQPTIRYYKIIHETPENIEILEDGTQITWLQLLEKAER